MTGKLVHHSPSIADVAEAAGVSRATVSNYLNGRSGRLSDETRGRIAAVVEQLGYRPMLGARRLSSLSRSGTVGLIVRRDLAGAFADPFMAEVMAGVGPALGASGLRSLVFTTPAGQVEDTDYLLSLARGIADGFLLFDLQADDRTVAALGRHGVPFVVVGQPEDGAPYPWVATDHAAAVAEAGAWLQMRGHQRIGLDQGPETILLHRQRRRGYLAAQAAWGLTADPESPTALLASWDAYQARPPEPGVEVVLLDGTGPAPSPVIGWIETPARAVGQRAAALLEARIDGLSPSPELLSARFHPALPPRPHPLLRSFP